MRLTIIILAVAVALVGMPQLFAERPDSIDLIPDELLGTWESGDGPYDGHSIEFSLDRFTVINGPGKVHTYWVDEVLLVPEQGITRYQINFTDDDVEASFSVRYRVKSEALLAFGGTRWLRPDVLAAERAEQRLAIEQSLNSGSMTSRPGYDPDGEENPQDDDGFGDPFP